MYHLDPYIIEHYDRKTSKFKNFFDAIDEGEEIVNWGIQLMGIPSLWKDTMGSDIKIAILDSGLASHPDFEEERIHRRNFTDSEECDESGHGTFIAGIIGASANGKFVVGIAPKSELYIGKVLYGKNDDLRRKDLKRGLLWAIEQEVHIISLSLRIGSYDAELHSLIKRATDEGIIIICASGNNDIIPFPAKFSETISVASIFQDKQIWSASGDGPELDFVAPGVFIRSTDIYGGVGIALEGTSFATPFIAGIAALILSASWSNKGSPLSRILNTDQLRLFLTKSCMDLGLPGRDDIYGFGLPIFDNGVPRSLFCSLMSLVSKF